jgi:hypothetical protein
MKSEPAHIDWSKTTFEGAERENLRAWKRLSFDEKLRANEAMNEMFAEIIRRKFASGEPYIDPDTGQVVRANRPTSEASRPVDGD